MAAKRIIEVEIDTPGSPILWMLAGTAVGAAAGVFIAERMSGRPLSGRDLLAQLRRTARRAARRWEPIVSTALDVRDLWLERSDDAPEDEEEFDESNGSGEEGEEGGHHEGHEGDEALDEDDAELDEGDDELDEDDDELDEDDDDLDEDDEEDDEDHDGDEDEEDESDDEDEPADSPSPIGARVLEAFLNDPILSERAVEIDADETGGVVLHGHVRISRDVAHAVTIARGVPGVTSVKQRLDVRDRR